MKCHLTSLKIRMNWLSGQGWQFNARLKSKMDKHVFDALKNSFAEADTMNRDPIENTWLVSHFSRREMLGLMGATAFGLLAAGCERGQVGSKGLRNLFSK